MGGTTITEAEILEYQKLKQEKAKQKHYQKVLNAKIAMQAKWAKANGCPVDSEHAEYYLGLPEHLRETMTVDQIIDAVKKAKSLSNETSTKNEGTEESPHEVAPEGEKLSA